MLEPTADYHRPIAYWLAQAGIQVPLACARAREALYTSRDKLYRKDARVLMYLLTHCMAQPFHR